MSKKYKNSNNDKFLEFKLQLSTPFIIRSRCKYCGSTPIDYFKMLVKRGYINPRDFINIKTWFYSEGSICDNFFIAGEPKQYTTIFYFSYYHQGLSYSPKLHMKNKSYGKKFLTDCMVCQCNKTYWYFNQMDLKDKPEVLNRKTQKTFSQKLFFY